MSRKNHQGLELSSTVTQSCKQAASANGWRTDWKGFALFSETKRLNLKVSMAL